MNVDEEVQNCPDSIMGMATEIFLVRFIAVVTLLQVAISFASYEGVHFAVSMVIVSLLSFSFLMHTQESADASDELPYLSHPVSRLLAGSLMLGTAGWVVWYSVQTLTSVIVLIPMAMLIGLIGYTVYVRYIQSR